ERVDWSESWRRSLVALVESPLDLVKQAACEGLVPLRLAVRATRTVALADQAEWLAEATLGPEPQEVRALESFDGSDGDTIRRGRRLARICLGRAATAREVDHYLVACWRDRVPAEEILAAGREAPPVPEPLPALSWAWCAAAGEPASIAEALLDVEQLQAVLRGRTAVIAKAWMLVGHEALWTEGFRNEEECAREVLGLSLRQAQRLARLGWTLDWYPEVEAAIRRGLPVRQADRIGRVGGPSTVRDWLAVAERVGRRELDRALDDVGDGPSRPILDAYSEAIRLATSAVGPEARVALPHPDPPLAPLPVRAPAELLPAARWWLETVRIPAKSGFARVKERDRHRCQNPECGRQSLRIEAHHLVMRSEGGSDELDNGVAACRVCHLRGLHGGRLTARAMDVGGRGAILWTWADGRQVLAFREVSTEH
nr:HNH endonuclease [Deltaproteobacteria bacterium]